MTSFLAALQQTVPSILSWPFASLEGIAVVLRVVFGVGAIVGSGAIAEAIATGVPRGQSHSMPGAFKNLSQKLTRREWLATLQLVSIAVIALPLLPNQAMGPWDALNPRTIGYLILFIAGISYVGYFAMRLFGDRVGLLATSAIGGLVSSTAVTLSFSRMAKKDSSNAAILGSGISLAAAIMAVRILIEVAVVNPSLLPLLIAPLAGLAIIPFVAAVIIAFRADSTTPSADSDLGNPLELGSALFFGVVLALLFLLVRVVEAWFGEAGVYVLSAISGITDVDALSLSLAQSTQRSLSEGGSSLSETVGATGIFIGAMVNTLIKGVMATVIGGWPLARWCVSILLVALMVGGVAMGGVLWWGVA